MTTRRGLFRLAAGAALGAPGVLALSSAKPERDRRDADQLYQQGLMLYHQGLISPAELREAFLKSYVEWETMQSPFEPVPDYNELPPLKFFRFGANGRLVEGEA